jgi:hypothetical protein
MNFRQQEIYEANKRIFQERIDAAKSINIAHFLQDRYNYPVKKDGREFIVQTNSNAGKINVFQNRNNRSTWLYKSWGTGEVGNIFQYLSRNEGAGDLTKAETVTKILQDLQHYSPSIFIQNNFAQSSNKKSTGKPDLTCLPHTSSNYLHSRGIDNKIIEHPKYANCIYNKLFFPDPDKPFSFLNTAFPVKNIAGDIVDFSMKNRQYTKDGSYQTFSSYVADGNKSSGLWTSSTDQNAIGKIKSFLIAESEIDALSYSKINPSYLNNSLDISFGGHIAEKQLGLINQLVQKYEPEKILFIVDNDTNGNKYVHDIVEHLSEFNAIKINIDFAPFTHKDWNEVLMAKEGLRKENIKPNSNPYTGKSLLQVRDIMLEEKLEKKNAVTSAGK